MIDHDPWAPELFLGQPPSPRSDLYSVGVMLFEILAGRPPHPLGSMIELVQARTRQAAPELGSVAPAVPGRVARAVDRLLERDPEVDAAIACLDGFEFDRAITLAESCRKQAADLRAVNQEARAELSGCGAFRALGLMRRKPGGGSPQTTLRASGTPARAPFVCEGTGIFSRQGAKVAKNDLL